MPQSPKGLDPFFFPSGHSVCKWRQGNAYQQMLSLISGERKGHRTGHAVTFREAGGHLKKLEEVSQVVELQLQPVPHFHYLKRDVHI